jgi:hypothetical protein
VTDSASPDDASAPDAAEDPTAPPAPARRCPEDAGAPLGTCGPAASCERSDGGVDIYVDVVYPNGGACTTGCDGCPIGAHALVRAECEGWDHYCQPIRFEVGADGCVTRFSLSNIGPLAERAAFESCVIRQIVSYVWPCMANDRDYVYSSCTD